MKIKRTEKVKNMEDLKKMSTKKNTYTQMQEKTAEMLWIYYEEGQFGKLNLHRAE